MPWQLEGVMEQRKRLVDCWLSSRFTVSELAREFEVSRKTAHKWIKRFSQGGHEALSDRSHARLKAPDRVAESIANELLKCKGVHLTWGPKKIRSVLQGKYPDRRWPAVSTIAALFDRHGLVKRRRRQGKVESGNHQWPYGDCPNGEWAADFKGQWRLGDGVYCFPLTVSDSYSRYILGCQALTSIKTAGVKASFEQIFRTYGLPDSMRTDGGLPFASHGRCMGLSKLSVWWLRLGIKLHRIPPATPTANARHERMHRPLKADTMLPLASNMLAQQTRFEQFKSEYNHERPHEGIGMRRPADLYRPKTRPFPQCLPAIQYPAHFHCRRVHAHGNIHLRGGPVFLSQSLAGEIVGLEEHETGWKVYFCHHLIADINGETKQVVFIN